ncbi:MAG TPA: guanylate kinase [Verrucomicrobiae bacterium]|nr:guanylate kinase [Verrucomicrobiae bacterium]
MSNKAPGGLFVVSAPSGGGKTSLTRGSIAELSRAGIAAEISVSYTTRAPRSGEQAGVHYHFTDVDTFKGMIARGELLEYAEIYGNFYGTGRARTAALQAQGRDVILDIDWQGARQIKQVARDAVGIFILPPSITKLEQRLRARKQDSDAEIARRMALARDEMSHYREYDYVIVNKEFAQAMAEFVAIFVARRLLLSGQELRHKTLIHKLLS